MDFRFFAVFVTAALTLELMILPIAVGEARKYRGGDYNGIDDKVTAKLAKSGYYKGMDNYGSWAMYEWTYKGKKCHVTFSEHNKTHQRISPLLRNSAFWNPPGGTYPPETEITVSRRTGRYKAPEGERRTSRLGAVLVLAALAAAYAIATAACGSPV